MRVSIIEKESGTIIATIPLVLGGLNYKPSEVEHFDEAWAAAVEDKLVDPTKRNNYTFKVLP